MVQAALKLIGTGIKLSDFGQHLHTGTISIHGVHKDQGENQPEQHGKKEYQEEFRLYGELKS